MDYRERFEDAQTAVRSALSGHQASIWTALPGIITSYDDQAITAHVQPALHSLYTGPDQTQEWKVMPVVPDVPVVFPRGGKYALTFPVTQGDECLIVFSSRCIDNWWQQGGVQTQRELRMHDLSDGFALVGPWSQKTKISNLSTQTTQLRTNDGKVYAEIDDQNQKASVVSNGVTLTCDSKQNQASLVCNGVSVVCDSNAGTVTITAPTVVINGDLHVTGAVIAGFGGATQVGLRSHRHGTTGTPLAAQTVPPTPGT